MKYHSLSSDARSSLYRGCKFGGATAADPQARPAAHQLSLQAGKQPQLLQIDRQRQAVFKSLIIIHELQERQVRQR